MGPNPNAILFKVILQVPLALGNRQCGSFSELAKFIMPIDNDL